MPKCSKCLTSNTCSECNPLNVNREIYGNCDCLVLY